MARSRQGKVTELDLFLDESGTFTETSTDATERARTRGRNAEHPSQLGGILAPRGSLNRETGRSALDAVFRAAGLPAPESAHGMDLPRGESYDRLIAALITELEQRRWQPVRLVNREQVTYGDRVATYTNLVAELAARVLGKAARQSSGTVGLRMVCALVKLGEDHRGNPILMDENAYQSRLQELLSRIAVRRGLATQSSNWRIDELRLQSARTWPELMLCDLVSNASYADFRKLGGETRGRLRSALGDYDISLTLHSSMEAVDTLLDQGSLGTAALRLAACASAPDRSDELERASVKRMDRLVDELAEVGAPARDPQFEMILAQLDQLSTQLRRPELALQQVAWFARHFEAPIRKRLDERDPTARATVDWFRFGLHRAALGAENASGHLAGAREQLAAMQRDTATVAGRFEHVELLMRGVIDEAIHHLQCREWDDATRLAQSTVTFYEDLGGLFRDALPLFPDQVRSDQRGAALAVWSECEFRRAAGDCGRLERATELAGQALDEFDSPAEKAHVRFCSSRIAAARGNFRTALEFLGEALDVEPTADDTADAIADLDSSSPIDGEGRETWFEIAARSILSGHAASSEFIDAFGRHQLDKLTRHTSLRPQVARFAATILAARGDHDAALSSIARLTESAPASRLDVIHFQLFAAQLELAGQLLGGQRKLAERLLFDGSRRPGALQTAEQIVRYAGDAFATVTAEARSWVDQLKSWRSQPEFTADQLWSLARQSS